MSKTVLSHISPLITKIVLFAQLQMEVRYATQTQIMSALQRNQRSKVKIQNFSFRGLGQTVMKTTYFLTQKGYQDFLSIQSEAFIKVQRD